MTEVCVIEDKTAVVVFASYRSVSSNPVHFKALVWIKLKFAKVTKFGELRETSIEFLLHRAVLNAK